MYKDYERIDLTENLIFAKRNKQKQSIRFINKETTSEYQSNIKYKDWEDGKYCDCCGIELNNFNRVYNLCKKCNNKLINNLK